ncbi:cytochrome P450 [Bacillus sp. JCM 19041]|uniref:cytochrome P450 n=1 Tax=Bacillus sp. JCM 19041 TaxID=1460637 RepID=UPI000A91798B
MLASTFYSLTNDQPSFFQELKDKPELIPKAIDEMLRFRFHIAARERICTKDNDLLGVDVKKGQIVKVWMSAANMDKEKFEDPFTLNIHRSTNKQHLTFGNGPHFCLGAPLAKMEIEHTLKAFIEVFEGIEAIKNFDLEANLTKAAAGQTLTHLPVRLF